MAAPSPLITLRCKNHYEKLTKGLWDRFLIKRGVDIEVEWAGLAVYAHKMVMEAFLSPDKLNRRAELGWHWEEENQCLDALLEFLYRGQVTVRHDQLDNLLEAARESEFQELVDSLEFATKKKGAKPIRTVVKSPRKAPTPEPVAPEDEEDPGSDPDYDPLPDMGNNSDGESNDGNVVVLVVGASDGSTQQVMYQQPSSHKVIRQPEQDLPAKKRKMDAAALVSESEAEVTAVAAAVVAANQEAEIAAANAAMNIATIPPEFAMLKRPRKKWTLHGDIPEVFECETCQKKFSRPYHLDRHVRSHVQYKPYVCDVCSKPFGDSGNLARHRRIHFKDKSQVCDLCNKGFSRAEQLAAHRRSCGSASSRQREYKRQQQPTEAAVVQEGEVVIAHVQHYTAGDNQQYVETANIDLSSLVFQF